MVMIEDGFNIYISAFFFISCVVICSYFLLNLTVAVMLEKFKRLKQRGIVRATKTSVQVEQKYLSAID